MQPLEVTQGRIDALVNERTSGPVKSALQGVRGHYVAS
jgi:hypothetical protein